MIPRKENDRPNPGPPAPKRFRQTAPPRLGWVGTIEQVAGAEDCMNVVLICQPEDPVDHAQAVASELARVLRLELPE
jgi:hypothetical protein